MQRLVVGAGYGLKDWLAQRVTAVVMAIYTIIFLISVMGGATASAEAWRATMSGGFMRFATFLFFVSLSYHAWVGVRDIWMDYVKCAALRLTLHVLTLLALVGIAGWAVQIIWRL
jgi:succinate dehydrogenase / fumarate reductase, membrane anchor subunit